MGVVKFQCANSENKCILITNLAGDKLKKIPFHIRKTNPKSVLVIYLLIMNKYTLKSR